MKKQKKEYLYICLLWSISYFCWGILYPQYAFTQNTYQLICEAYAQDEDAVKEEIAQAFDYEDFTLAGKEGRVTYSFKFIEYLKNFF